ncbi:biogenesis of lysosome-related organelles complex 1 subunit 2 isoform X2 [Cloeon dipterum]|uniref:biogenesis of lysosome-related organelles complex 1 subunit 2 isoform X2 n=1 Tax=Cloeon dipterum TaxID=197152 RepID=UPI003220184F
MADEMENEGVTDSPKKGPTLSTSTSSFEALDPHDPNLSRLANTMFQKTGDYLYGELTATQEDYKLLENMNHVTVKKYSDMRQIASNVSKSLIELNEKFSQCLHRQKPAAVPGADRSD